MPSATRRTVLAGLGTVLLGGTTGCSRNESSEPPVGSLRFTNGDEVPHVITIRVLDVGTGPGDSSYSVTGETTVPQAQRTLTASTTIPPGDTKTYDSVFTEPVWYKIQFTVDNQKLADEAGHVVYSPVPEDEPIGRMLTGKVGSNGGFWWTISATDNPGDFNI